MESSEEALLNKSTLLFRGSYIDKYILAKTNNLRDISINQELHTRFIEFDYLMRQS